jgi:methylglutaconyl-CoA hydratase
VSAVEAVVKGAERRPDHFLDADPDCGARRLQPHADSCSIGPMSTSQPAVLTSLDARGVASVTLNRPEVNNAYDETLIQGLHAAMDALGARPEVRVVVLRGAGKHFQAGADLKWIRRVAAQDAAENERVSRATAMAVHRLNNLPVPTVALVQGGCFGGGTGIVAACDVVIAADDALFSIAETRWGLTAAIILPQLADAIGARQVRRYALSGERFGAQEARRIGLAHEVVPLAELEAAGERLVAQLLQNAPEANAQTKAAALGLAWGAVDDATLERLVAQHAAKRRSAEATEGLASFVEKRAASWQPESRQR